MENKANITRASYSSLEEIQARKEKLKDEIHQQSGQISTLWHDLVTPQESNSKGELIAHLISNSITAIDGFLLARKLMKSYSYIFGRKKRK